MCISMWHPEVGMAKNLLRALHADTLAPPVSNTCLRPCRRQVILSILRPSLEYGNEVWRCTSTQSKALDAVLLGDCKKILSCSSKTCNEAVWGDFGVEPLYSFKSQAFCLDLDLVPMG